MKNLRIMHLHLGTPLRFIPDTGLEPFTYDPQQGEALFCFSLDQGEYRSMEPNPRIYLADSIQGGKAEGEAQSAEDEAVPAEGASTPLELPPGVYLFAQIRDMTDREILIRMIMEIQREGLRQGCVLDRRVYLRYLYEDGSPVSQIFRPMEAPPSS